MAVPPSQIQFRRTDFGSDGLGDQDALDKFFQPLNQFIRQTCQALNGGLTTEQNSQGQLKTISVTVPTGAIGPDNLPFVDCNASTSQSLPANTKTIINFDVVNTDTSSAVTTGSTWKFTAPVAGVYSVECCVSVTATTAAGEYILYVFKNSTTTEYRVLSRLSFLSAETHTYHGGTNIRLAAGDFISVAVLQNSVNAQNTSTTSTNNWVTIQALQVVQPVPQACFPFTVSTSIASPKTVEVASCDDTGTSPVPIALGAVHWQQLSVGKIQILNIPGLLQGRTYNIGLRITAG